MVRWGRVKGTQGVPLPVLKVTPPPSPQVRLNSDRQENEGGEMRDLEQQVATLG